MIKRFHKILSTHLTLSMLGVSISIFPANFSVDNSHRKGPGSLHDVILSSNAIFPGPQLSNQIFLRSDLVFSNEVPVLRQNIQFNVLDDCTAKFLSPVTSSASFTKLGGGTLDISAPWVFLGPWDIRKGILSLNHSQEGKNDLIVQGALKYSNPSFLNEHSVYLNKGTLLAGGSGFINSVIHIEEASTLSTGPHRVSCLELMGSGDLIKIGSGLFEMPQMNTFKGSLHINEGGVELKNSHYKGKVHLNEGFININTEMPIQNYKLVLKKGDISVLSPEILLRYSLELTGSDANIYLNSNTLTLNKAISGWGLLHFMGPGSLQLKGENPLCAQLYFENVDMEVTHLAKNSSYNFKNVELSYKNNLTIDATTQINVGAAGLDLRAYEHKLNVLGTIVGEGTILSKSHGLVFYHPQNKFQGRWIQNQGEFVLKGDLAALQIDKEASFHGSGRIDHLTLSGGWSIPISSEGTLHFLQVQSAQILGDVTLMPTPGEYTTSVFPLIAGENIELEPLRFLVPSQFEGKLIKDNEGVKYQLDKFHSLSSYLGSKLSDDKTLAASLDQIFAPAGSDMDQVITQLLSLKDTPALYNTAFQGLQPAYFSALGLVQESNFILARSALSNRMQELITFPCAQEYVYDQPFSLWMDPVIDLTEQKSIQGDMGYRGTTYGAFIGFDAKIHPKFRFGVTTGYTYSDVNWMESVGSGFVNSTYLASYFLYKPSSFYLNGSLSGGYSRYNVHREININSIKRTAQHTNNGFGFSADMEFGVIIAGRTTLQPFIRQSYIGLTQQKFTEEGAGSLNLEVAAKNFSMYRIEAGFVFNRCLDYATWTLSPEFSLSGIYEQELQGGDFQARYEDTQVKYTVIGMKPTRTLFAPGVALDALIKKYPLMMGLRYHAELGSQFYDQRISGHMAYSF